jgi:hypothetical protein
MPSAMRPVTIKTGFFDDPPDHQQTLWGVWANTTRSLPKLVTQLDVYYLGLYRKKATSTKAQSVAERLAYRFRLDGKAYVARVLAATRPTPITSLEIN